MQPPGPIKRYQARDSGWKLRLNQGDKPMSAKIKLLAGAAGLATLAGLASPAAAQYPGYGYGNGYNNNPVGQIVSQIFGYGRYPYGNYGYNQGYNNQSAAIDQCARAVEAQLNGYNGYYGYGNVP